MPGAQIGKGIGSKTVILLLKNVISFINIVVDKGRGGKNRIPLLNVYQCTLAGACMCWVFNVSAIRQLFKSICLKKPSFKRSNILFFPMLLPWKKVALFHLSEVTRRKVMCNFMSRVSSSHRKCMRHSLLWRNTSQQQIRVKKQCKWSRFSSIICVAAFLEPCLSPELVYIGYIYIIYLCIF